MFGQVRKLLGIGTKTEPVLMRNVDPAEQNPEKEKQVHDAVSNLVSSLIEFERRSYQVRKELASLTIHIVTNRTDN